MGILDKMRGKTNAVDNRMSHAFLEPRRTSGLLANSKTHRFGKHVFTASGANLRMQALWRSLPEWKKNQLRRILPDSDRDGVPDKFDCQPLNPRKQDMSDAEIVRELSRGREGESHPIGHSNSGAYRTPMEQERFNAGRLHAAEEGNKYRRYDASGETPYTEREGYGGVREAGIREGMQVFGDQKETKKKFLGIF